MRKILAKQQKICDLFIFDCFHLDFLIKTLFSFERYWCLLSFHEDISKKQLLLLLTSDYFLNHVGKIKSAFDHCSMGWWNIDSMEELFAEIVVGLRLGLLVSLHSCFYFVWIYYYQILFMHSERVLKNRLWLKSAWIDQKRVQRSFIILRIYYEVAKVWNRSSYDANLLTLRALLC